MFLFVQMITLELDIWYAQFKRVMRPIFDHRSLMGMILLDVEIGKKHHSCVGCDENQNVPNAVQVRKAKT